MRSALVATALFALVACDTSGEGDLVVGAYAAVRYITPAPNDGPLDHIAAGGGLALHLAPDGTYTGDDVRLAAVTSTSGPITYQLERTGLAGTYRVQGDTLVVFDEADGGWGGRLGWTRLPYDAARGVLADSVFGISPSVLVLERVGR